MSRMLHRVILTELRQSQARVLAEAMDGRRMADPRSPGGDPERLRGIPAIGRSVSGAIRGTDPEREAMRRRTNQKGMG